MFDCDWWIFIISFFYHTLHLYDFSPKSLFRGDNDQKLAKLVVVVKCFEMYFLVL